MRQEDKAQLISDKLQEIHKEIKAMRQELIEILTPLAENSASLYSEDAQILIKEIKKDNESHNCKERRIGS